MIELRYQGGLGENLFQYCLARALAESWCYQLKALPIWGFPNTSENVGGDAFISPITQWSGIQLHSWATGESIDTERLSFPTNGRLILDGWFQSFEYLADRFTDIRDNWLLPDTEYARRSKNEVAISLRLGHTTRWRQDRLRHANWDTPPDYPVIEEARLSYLIEQFQGARIHVMTDRPDDKLVEPPLSPAFRWGGC